MNEIIALTLTSVFFGFYIILSSIEFGSSVFAVFPKLLDGKVKIESYVNPLWETNNVFLIVFVISLVVFFPLSIASFGKDLLFQVFTVLFISGLRILCVLFIFYADSKIFIARIGLFICSVLVPVLFAQTAAYVVTGTTSFTILNIGVGLFALMSIFALAFSFFNIIQQKETIRKLKQLAGISCVLFFISILYLLVTAFKVNPYLFSNLYKVATIEILLAVTMLFTGIFWLISKPILFFGGIALTTLATIFSLFYLLFPYLIYPTTTIYSSFTDQKLFPFYLGAFIGGMILVVPSLVLLYSLFIFKKSKISERH